MSIKKQFTVTRQYDESEDIATVSVSDGEIKVEMFDHDYTLSGTEASELVDAIQSAIDAL